MEDPEKLNNAVDVAAARRKKEHDRAMFEYHAMLALRNCGVLIEASEAIAKAYRVSGLAEGAEVIVTEADGERFLKALSDAKKSMGPVLKAPSPAQ